MFIPIAIVGRACLLPGARSPDELWQVLQQRRTTISPAPASRWRASRERMLAERICASDIGGFVTDIQIETALDPHLDPLVHWLVHVARNALRDAGIENTAQTGRAGAIVGNLAYPTESLVDLAESLFVPEAIGKRTHPLNRFSAGFPVHLLCRTLNLGSGGFAIDAACASSLYAIKIACGWLQTHRADVMLAGGINRVDALLLHAGFTALNALSSSGRSRPFHRDADGIVPAEGAAFLALKRLADAETSGDRILGIIRGIGVSNDGRGRGLLAPSVAGQVRAMKSAYMQSGLQPADISLIECHATGTSVGDAVELESLSEVFHGLLNVPIGSLKSNLGHLITVSGVAGIIKVIEAFRHDSRPATLNATPATKAIEGTPFRLLTEEETWTPAGDAPRRAAISNFGFGGNNAHLLLEEYRPEKCRAVIDRPYSLGYATVGALYEGVNELGSGPSPSGRGRREAPGEGRKSRQILKPSPCPLPEGEGDFLNRQFIHTLYERPPRRAAVVAIAARLADGESTEEFESDLESGKSRIREFDEGTSVARAKEVRLPSTGLVFPPRDLERALAQQNVLLEVAGEAIERAGVLPLDRTSAFIAMSCDAEVARTVLRPALADLLRHSDVSDTELAERENAMDAGFDRARVVGCMPNIPANRLNCQFDLWGPSFTLSAEELSGIRALDVAIDALAANEIDAALVGAADFCVEPVHRSSAGELQPDRRIPGDGACALILKRVEDAIRNNDPIRAIVELVSDTQDPTEESAFDDRIGKRVRECFGHVHAASGLLEVAAAAVTPAFGQMRLRIDALGGQSAVVIVTPSETSTARRTPPLSQEPRPTLRLPAHPDSPDVVVMRPAPPLAEVESLNETRPSEPRFAYAAAVHAQMSVGHQEHLLQMARIDEAYQQTQARLLQMLTGDSRARPSPPGRGRREAPGEGCKSLRNFEFETLTLPSPRGRGWKRPQFQFVHSSIDRPGLETHASGRVSDLFGPAFRNQDDYRRQVRMPGPPLLLADRVISLTGEAGSLGPGSITTETDVRAGSWYLHQGRMPAGLHIEAGQADLMLISWLGIDKLNKGARVYRLLGCDLSFSGAGLPRVGETLRYDIHVDAHTSHAGVRMFKFHYDCTSNGIRRLTVRDAQAGFFTDEELASSEGILWTPETAEHTPAEKARLDPAPRISSRRSFDPEHVRAFAEGRPADCFGTGFEYSLTHTRTPRTQKDRMQLLESVPAFDPNGGPWKRGYLRAESHVRPDDWFFEGHFKNDPCMPGTLMFEGSLQAIAFYTGALGFTLERDGWRFEPAPDEVYALQCRGQVTPSSKRLVYEVFVDEIVAGPMPTLYADVLCTVDGLKAFHCRRLGLRLVPDWPLDESQPERSANAPFDYESLKACALGRPSNAFGPAFARFDGPVKVPRLPGDPYHFISRITHVTGDGPRALIERPYSHEPQTVGAVYDRPSSPEGGSVDVEYDVPADAWYFADNVHPVMPISVLVEVLLQPCGWLASFAGTWKQIEHDIFFRNLDGEGIVHAEVGPFAGTLRTRTRLTSCSRMGTTSITAFEINCHSGEQIVFEGKAVFGHFPAEALKNQTGLPSSEDEVRWLNEDAPAALDLDALQEVCPIGKGRLRTIDRITGYWPNGGSAGLGRVRSELDVDPGQWFFKAHFFGDPVQPGSLGLQAVVQTLQAWMLATNRQDGLLHPRFEPIALAQRVSWMYRGQVLPYNRRVTILLEVLEAGPAFAKAAASLWVDGTKIYAIPNVAMRMVESSAVRAVIDRPYSLGYATVGPLFERPPTAEDSAEDSIEEIDPARDTWLQDHRPTYTIPALPMMSVVDRLAAAAHRSSGGQRVVELRDVTLNGWIAFPSGSRRLKTSVVKCEGECFEVTLSVWREARQAALSRYDAMATAVVRVAAEYPESPSPLPPLSNSVPAGNPYESGELFHGPRFQILRDWFRSACGSSFILDPGRGDVPFGFLNQGLLDGVLHGIPNENISLWTDRISDDQVGYPSRIPRLAFFAPAPRGVGRGEVRFCGFHQDDGRFPKFLIQLIDGGKVWAELELVYVVFPKGPLGNKPAVHRRDFLQDKKYVAGMELGRFEEDATCLTPGDIYASDWLPGTIANAFGLKSADPVRELAVKQHVARTTHVHPAEIVVLEDGQCAALPRFPLNRFPMKIEREGEVVRVRSEKDPAVDCGKVRVFWHKMYGVADWPVADLYVGLLEKFLRRLEITAPAAFEMIRGKPVLFLANHQVAVESILFTAAISALSEMPIKVIAKAEHRQSWIGELIQLMLRYPGVHDAAPILYFDRADSRDLLRVLAGFRAALAQQPASLMVHTDGTRALSCRTPVSQVSSVLLDLAAGLNIPVVPVRFTGGLPAEPVKERLEFPFGGGRQDIRIGRPISPKELLKLPLVERSQFVLDAMNALAPVEETGFVREPGDLPVRETLVDALRSASRRSAESEMVLRALDGADVNWPGDGLGQWLRDFTRWLRGRR